MTDVVNQQLADEYKILQAHYEAFDAKSLTIKGWSAPLLGAGIGFGIKECSMLMVSLTLLVTISLWAIECIWKTFQYCYARRIVEIEKHFRGEIDASPPYQIFSKWNADWRARSMLMNLRPFTRPFVFLPYLPISAAAVAALIWLGTAGR